MAEPRRCDACGKRRKTTMHPIGMDLCRECAAMADRPHPKYGVTGHTRPDEATGNARHTR